MTNAPQGFSRSAVVVLGVVVLVVLAAGATLVFRGRKATNGSNANVTTRTGSGGVVVPVRIDSDADGLTDDEERTLRTDPKKVDTDGDGLSDYEEVKVYGTDPLKGDTDGDGHSDGAEIAQGFNPKGDGPLLPTAQAIQNANAAAAPTNAR